MSSTGSRSEHAGPIDKSDAPRHVASDRDNTTPLLITLGAVAVAALLAWVTWQAYMGTPWTRDSTVRAYVVTMAPEMAGRIVKLPVADNQFVHKGDVLFEIDPADYRIALEHAQAQAQRDGAALDYARKNEDRKASLAKEGWTSTDIYQQTTSTLHQSEGVVAWTRPPSPRRSSISAGP
jgi:multidrug resistance efflux pump